MVNAVALNTFFPSRLFKFLFMLSKEADNYKVWEAYKFHQYLFELLHSDKYDSYGLKQFYMKLINLVYLD